MMMISRDDDLMMSYSLIRQELQTENQYFKKVSPI